MIMHSNIAILAVPLLVVAATCHAVVPPNFCEEITNTLNSNDPSPYCIGTLSPCRELDATACNAMAGCSIFTGESEWGSLGDQANAAMGQSECVGTTEATSCSDYHGGNLQCIFGIGGIKGCEPYLDPPCEKDPFDVAITPFLISYKTALDEVGCSATADRGNSGCLKNRVSADGDVTLYIAGSQRWDDENNIPEVFTSCEMQVNGKFCQSCTLCEGSTTSIFQVAFHCANALTRSSIPGDEERCPVPGERCVGQDCFGNCICQSITDATNATTTTTTEPPTKQPTSGPQQQLFDAYIYTRHVRAGQPTNWPNATTANSNNTDTREFCDQCRLGFDEDDDCVQISSLIVQDQCVALRRDQSQETPQGFTYYTYNTTNGPNPLLCPVRYTKDGCDDPSTAKWSCGGGIQLNTCDERYNITTRALNDWCVVGPSNEEFSVPVLKIPFYRTLEECHNDFGMREEFMTMDKKTCKSFGTSVNGTLVRGSLRNYCDEESNAYTTDFYSDPYCQEQSTDLDVTRRVAVVGECTEFFNFAMGVKGYTKPTSCDTQGEDVIFCKPLYHTLVEVTQQPEGGDSTGQQQQQTSSTENTLAPIQIPTAAAASATNFCYDLDGNPPYCYGDAKDCGDLDVIACDTTPGCKSDTSFAGLATSLTTGDAQCTGTTAQRCSDLEYGPGCEFLKGCQSDYDPPCDRDPFDIAILPLDGNSIVCGAQSTGQEVQTGCVKTRPSADGQVTVYMEGGSSAAGSYSRCVMTVDGRDCQSCSICGGSGSQLVAFQCANLLSVDRVEGDERCSESGSRCVGRDCKGNCICGTASLGSSSSSFWAFRKASVLLVPFLLVFGHLFH